VFFFTHANFICTQGIDILVKVIGCCVTIYEDFRIEILGENYKSVCKNKKG